MNDDLHGDLPIDHPIHEEVEDREALTQLAEQHGLGGVRVAAELIEDELKAKSRLRRLTEMVVAAAITVVIFVRVIPQILDVEYREVWERLAMVDRRFTVFLCAFWLFTMWTYGSFVAASLPGVSRLQGMVLNFSGSALANVVPFGGAAGVGATYAQAMSWGCSMPSVTLSIIVTGVWNVFAKLGFPVLVLAGLALTHQSSQGLGVAGMIGFAVLVGAVVGMALLFMSDRVAHAVGGAAEGALNTVRRLFRRPTHTDVAARIIDFRARTVGLVRERGLRLTLWMVAYKMSQATLQLLCARAVGVEGVGWLQIFAVYTFGELLTTIPVTPGGVGFVEGGASRLLIAFGADPNAALAAVVLYRAFTYLLEIPLGALGWLVWATRSSWRRPIVAGT